MLGIGLAPFMSGLWGKLVFPPSDGPYLMDANGTTLTVGQTVKLVGVITSLNQSAAHFDGVSVRATHPNGSGPNVGEIFTIDPQQLVVGS